MRIFLDSIVVIAACLSATGASRIIFDLAAAQGWDLVVSPWILREVSDNLSNESLQSVSKWVSLRSKVSVEDDELTFDWPIVFHASKDKPVLYSALACADVLLTLDRRDFRGLLGQVIYGLLVLTPGEFLNLERQAGRL